MGIGQKGIPGRRRRSLFRNRARCVPLAIQVDCAAGGGALEWERSSEEGVDAETGEAAETADVGAQKW